ncbi:ornithine cyclodeaminase [Rhodoligotrophos appendicifer]|uniref:ornithine cyclodeaminase family protein n=1 Tax=Rhodoligotrophos appendicifer TaxID=987056 RepID=UPI0011852AB8|nr:ornithine cyclodeaminase family protein [Rhodoligotrophos appendicifer]
MRIITAETLAGLLTFPGLVDALAAAHRAPMPLVDRSELHHDRGAETPDTFFVLPAWAPGRAYGAKLVTVMPGNPSRAHGLPAVQGSYLLFDGQTGTPAAVIDGTMLTYFKTAADSALGARLLARSQPKALLVTGAGALAPYLVRAHLAVKPSLDRVLVWNRTAAKAEALARDLASEGIAASPVADLEAAARQSDIITCATASTAPYLEGAWLKPGCHLDLVGSFTPAMRECDDEAVRRASLFCDSWAFGVDQPGDLADPLSRGIIARTDILGDLFDLCQGRKPGRTSETEITLFKNGGGAHLDLFTAIYILDQLERAA